MMLYYLCFSATDGDTRCFYLDIIDPITGTCIVVYNWIQFELNKFNK